jgi:hypothetical protein
MGWAAQLSAKRCAEFPLVAANSVGSIMAHNPRKQVDEILFAFDPISTVH